MGKTTKTYTIVTDGGMMDQIEAENVAEAIAQFGGIPNHVKTAEDFESWLDAVGGYGQIDEDDVRIANVQS